MPDTHPKKDIKLPPDLVLDPILKSEIPDLPTSLYQETGTPSIAASITQNDFEVYYRRIVYDRKVNRHAMKLLQKIKWMPYELKH